MVNMNSQLLYQLSVLNEQNTKVTAQLSSGKELEVGSDDSKLYGYILGLEEDIKVYSGIEEQIEKTLIFNDSSDSLISEIKTNMEAVISEVLTALNDTTDATTKASMSENLGNIKETIFNFLNEEIDGTYLYSGKEANTTPFEMDSDGNVDYVGSLDYKTTIVDKSLYKEQGVTGMDLMYYTQSSAANTETLSFSDGQRIVDSDNNEWIFLDQDNDGSVETDFIYLNGDTNTSISVASSGTPTTYTLTNNQDVTLDVKQSYFDDLDEIINALAGLDTSGNTITEAEADVVLSDSLEKMDMSYDSINYSHSILGGRNSSFDSYSTSMSAKLTNYNIFYSEFASADLTTAALEAQSLESTYSALYSTISKVNSLSLVNYL